MDAPATLFRTQGFRQCGWPAERINVMDRAVYPLVGRLIRLAEVDPHAIAVADLQTSLTYEQLVRRASSVASLLVSCVDAPPPEHRPVAVFVNRSVAASPRWWQ